MQSKPSAWLSASRVRAVRTGPMCCSERFSETATAVGPAAWSSGEETVRSDSS